MVEVRIRNHNVMIFIYTQRCDKTEQFLFQSVIE